MNDSLTLAHREWPQHKRILKTHSKFGDRRADPYFWLRARDSKSVLDFLNVENKYADKKLKPVRQLQRKLFREFKARIKEDDVSAPFRLGSYFYFTKYKKGREYPIYCRRKIQKLGQPVKMGRERRAEVILDVNKLARKHKYFDVINVRVSHDQNWLLYAVDTVGRRFYTLHFKNLITGKTLRDAIADTTGNAVWMNDNKTVLFGRQNPKTLRADRIFKYKIGNKQSQPTLVYYEKDEKFFTYVSKSLTQNEVYIYSESSTAHEWRTTSAFDPEAKFKIFLKRAPKHEYSVFDGGDVYFILSNRRAPNFRLLVTDKKETAPKKWREVVPHRKDVLIEDVLVLKDWIVLQERKNGLPQLTYLSRGAFGFANPSLRTIAFPDPTYVTEIGANAEYEAKAFQYVYESPNRPETVLSFDFKTKRSVLLKAAIVPTYKKANYVSKRLWAKANDGVRVPISVVYRRDRFKKGKNPLLVYGYGSYGLNCDPDFDRFVISLLDRGFVFAIAHIRGGSEMGRHWYDNGKLRKKKNTFSDFISTTEFLIRAGIGKLHHIYAMGGSAGGLLMGAIVNMRPDLYNGIVAAVPFVDALTTMLDDSLPLTTNEYEEWGNPNVHGDYRYIKSYSPYDNIRKQAYPHILATTGYHDSQVQYWEPAKWIAKLRDFTTRADHLYLLKTEMSAGHSGTTGRFESLKVIALEYAFILLCEGITK